MARVAMVMGPEFEDSEYSVPREALIKAGHEVVVIGTASGEKLKGKRGREMARVDKTPKEQRPTDFAAIVIPGGHSPDHIRTDKDIVDFVREFVGTGRPVAAVCHGPQLLIEAGAVKGKKLTSWPSVKTDLINAGASWVNERVVEDGSLITSRKPDDLEAFSKAILNRLT